MDVASYTVHSVSECDIAMSTEINGAAVDVKVPGLVVELVNDLETYTRRLVPADMDAAKEFYAVGNVITVSLSAAE